MIATWLATQGEVEQAHMQWPCECKNPRLSDIAMLWRGQRQLSRRVLLAAALLLVFVVLQSLAMSENDSVCFNDCSGHGACMDFECKCYEGYYGDDCRISAHFVACRS